MNQNRFGGMTFTVKDWAWGLLAYARFWDKKFQAPYVGLTYRQSMILMRLRGQRPATLEEVSTSTNAPVIDRHYAPTLPIDAPRVNIGRFNATGLTAWESDPNLGVSVTRDL